ncbi:MAG: family 10 glycosylhydrolase [Thermoguttaceae bacterium]
MRVSLAVIAVLAASMSWTTVAMAADGAAQQPAKAAAAESKATGVAAQKPARVKPAYPDGQIRGVFGLLPTTDNRETGLRQIEASVDKCRAGGLNSIFVSVSSRYLAALDDPKFQTDKLKVSWDALGELIRAAKKQNIQVHAWYSPWIRKEKARAVELELHPEWAALTAKGVVSPKGVLCFVRPEVRQFELDVLSKMMDRYPDLAGIHIEEPGYRHEDDFCYCDRCRAFCRKNFGLDIRKNLEDSKPTVHSLAAFMCTDFFIRLRKIMNEKRPDMWLSANGGYNDAEWFMGRDWHNWARRGLIDFYMPQIYCRKSASFASRAAMTKQSLGGCDMVPIIGVSWQAIAPEKKPPEAIKMEITAAQKLGTKGFAVFCERVLDDAHYQAIHEAIRKKPTSATEP